VVSEEITWLNGFRGDDFGLVASEEITWLNGFRGFGSSEATKPNHLLKSLSHIISSEASELNHLL
jgi:hypothetical protein